MNLVSLAEMWMGLEVEAGDAGDAIATDEFGA
jgi:hypothetical protein